jgi:DNA topoisomerase-1
VGKVGAKDKRSNRTTDDAAGAPDLVYLRDDDAPGFGRIKTRSGFRYVDTAGRSIRDEATIARIRKLAIPPAWTDVWVSPLANGHLQATGRDAKGRKQYRYHPRWRDVRDRQKYQHTLAFGEALPAIRQRVEADLGLRGLPREKVLATVIKLLETSLIRVGNEEYARDNGSVGLSTMRDKHARVDGSELRFEFKGKSGKLHRVTIRNRRLARIVKQCQEIPGYELFQYVDEDGERRNIDSSDVNAYLREISGADFTAKDFRTWAGTVLASLALREFETFESPTEAKRNLTRAVETVAKRLGNTPAICRTCYIHPTVVESYLEGDLAESLRRQAEESLLSNAGGLNPDEAAVLALIRTRLHRRGRQKQPA